MGKHILLEKAKCYEINMSLPTPDNCIFFSSIGYWVNSITGKPMMQGDNPRKLQSKKHDIETGEDQKGE
ncbi:hypothetical protein LY28_03695 [Ruminiclostridium sufflavum DSM 19573]|uniref:Uncharacterized protein n=1 Tax=Ruminiclostridium sufflavum DSM 19573 TaxID=1121337 RepID=A0A318XII9_9FIRM|nr:hypothetical protein [Ruminiclostridium sufflavum]PYG84275.1 hypothetical protein LY28_03695 [Ruminiclostridium sufflavum DSM 19573]